MLKVIFILGAARFLGTAASTDKAKDAEVESKPKTSTWKDLRSGAKDADAVSVSMQSHGAMSKTSAQAEPESTHPSLMRKDPNDATTHEKHADSSKEVVNKAKAQGSVFEFDDDDAEDAALDELEALTIANAMLHKHARRRRRRRIDCKWSPWVDGKCSKTCGMGTKTKTRKMAPKKAHGGKDCNGDPSKDDPCDVGDCPADPTPAPTPAMTTTAAFAKRMANSNILALVGLATGVVLTAL